MSEEKVATCDCKIGRLRRKYLLDGLNHDLKTRWLGEGRERFSLRDLERYVNKLILRNAMEESDIKVLEGEVENKYRILTDDEVSSATVVRLEHMLKREGVDLESIRNDFVSHQTIYNHLRDCLDVSRNDNSNSKSHDRSFQTIRALQRKTQLVTKNIIQSADILDSAEDFYVSVDIQIIRENGERVLIEELENQD